jgi:hypothetical protein
VNNQQFSSTTANSEVNGITLPPQRDHQTDGILTTPTTTTLIPGAMGEHGECLHHDHHDDNAQGEHHCHETHQNNKLPEDKALPEIATASAINSNDNESVHTNQKLIMVLCVFGIVIMVITIIAASIISKSRNRPPTRTAEQEREQNARILQGWGNEIYLANENVRME